MDYLFKSNNNNSANFCKAKCRILVKSRRCIKLNYEHVKLKSRLWGLN